MKKICNFIILMLIFAFFVGGFNFKPVVFSRAELDLKAQTKAALLYDAKSGTVIYSFNEDKRLPIASMTKLASLMLVFEAINEGKISEDTLVKISKNAAETEGSSAFLDEKSEYNVGDLIMTVIVCSANDSTVALAEAVYGSEDNFVKKMNEKAKFLGLKNTNFINATGLPAVDHYSSACDIAKIYSEICDNEIYKKYSKIWMTELIHPSGRKTDIVNTNRLIKTYEGCDSGKTGFTNDAGFCLAASATRGDMKLIGVVIGAQDSKTRFNEMANMFNYGFKNYENKVIIESDLPFLETDVSNSIIDFVKLYPEKDCVKFLKKGEEFKYSIDYKVNKLKAPIKANDKVGTLYVLDKNNMVVFEESLIVKEDVKEIKIKDILQKIYHNLSR